MNSQSGGATRLFIDFAVCLATLAIAAADPVRFIPATRENTTLVDGSPVNTKDREGAWKWLPDEGNRGIFETSSEPKRNAPPLVLMVNDLKAGADYEVFGYFWAHGFGEAKDAQGKNGEFHHWPARFGLGLATLTTYGADIPRLARSLISGTSPADGQGLRRETSFPRRAVVRKFEHIRNRLPL